MADTIRVLVVDDYPLLREGIRSALNEMENIRAIGFTDHTADAFRLCEQLTLDVLLYSPRPTDELSLDLIGSLHEQYPSIKILVLVDKQQSKQASEILSCGASGMLLKQDPLPLLERAIRTIYHSGVWLSPSILPSAIQPPTPMPSFTNREREVLHLIARGWDNATIAAELGLKRQTIRNYTSRIYSKLDVSSREEAIVWAIANGFGEL